MGGWCNEHKHELGLDCMERKSSINYNDSIFLAAVFRIMRLSLPPAQIFA